MLTLIQSVSIVSISQSEWPCAMAHVTIALAAFTGFDTKMVSPYRVRQTIGAIDYPPFFLC
jgi:glycerol uptake facilitator-like aquaporin